METVAKRSWGPRSRGIGIGNVHRAHPPSPACACRSAEDQRPCTQAEAALRIGHEVSSWMRIWWRWNLEVAGGH